MAITVRASAARAAGDQSQYWHVSTALPPAATGITGIWMSRLAKAPVSSVRATTRTAPMYSRNVALTVSSVSTARPPSTAPTPIAAGRVRAALLGCVGGGVALVLP